MNGNIVYYKEKFFIHVRTQNARGEFQSMFFYKPKEQAVRVDVQPNHSEIGTS